MMASTESVLIEFVSTEGFIPISCGQFVDRIRSIPLIPDREVGLNPLVPTG